MLGVSIGMFFGMVVVGFVDFGFCSVLFSVFILI